MKSALKIIGSILGIVVVVAVIGGVVAVTLGYAYAGVKQPQQVVSVRTVTCGANDIKTYNVFVTTFVLTEEAQAKKAADMQAQVDALKDKAGFAQDPTCQFIAYSAAIAASDDVTATSYYDALVTLSEQGHYPSNELLDLSSLDSMKARIDAFNNTDNTNPDSRGSG